MDLFFTLARQTEAPLNGFCTRAIKGRFACFLKGESMSAAANSISPLAPHILAQANVPLDDAHWLHSQSATPGFFVSLRTERGTRILNQVRAFLNPSLPSG